MFRIPGPLVPETAGAVHFRASAAPEGRPGSGLELKLELGLGLGLGLRYILGTVNRMSFENLKTQIRILTVLFVEKKTSVVCMYHCA